MNLKDTSFAKRGWAWVPGVYFAEGLPMAVVSMVSVVMLQSFGMPVEQITLWTSILVLPWSLKFLWAPLLDLSRTKRFWMLLCQAGMSLCFLALPLTTALDAGTSVLIAVFFATAFVSATHDAAADGYYMLALSEHDQAFCAGLRNVFYKCAILTGQGGFVILYGFLRHRPGADTGTSWSLALIPAAVLMLMLFAWHCMACPAERVPERAPAEKGPGYLDSFLSFFRRDDALAAIVFLLLFRFAEAQLGKISTLFLLASPDKGGFGWSYEFYGAAYATAGNLCFLAGGFLGGIAVAKSGFGKCLWPMALALNVPDIFYLILALAKGSLISGGAMTGAGYLLSSTFVALEQFGYGFGFMAHMLFMVQFANSSGKFKTSHFALMTGVTILGMTLAGIGSGYVQKALAVLAPGLPYVPFFLWVCIATVPSFLAVAFVRNRIDSQFGRKTN